MEHYKEVGIINSVATFRSIPRRPSGELFWFQIQNMCKYQHGLLLDFGIRTQLLSTKQTGIVNCRKQSATLGTCCSQSSSVVLMMPMSNRRRTSFFSPCDMITITKELT